MMNFGSVMKIIIKNTINNNVIFFDDLKNKQFSTDKSTISRILNQNYIPSSFHEPKFISDFIEEIIEKHLSIQFKNDLIMQEIFNELINSSYKLPNENEIIHSLQSKLSSKDINGFLKAIIPLSIYYSKTEKEGKDQDTQKLSSYQDLIIVNTQSMNIGIDDIHFFHKGFEATWGCIFKNIPVQRTIYLKKKQTLLQYASDFKMKSIVNVYTIVGPKGVGKTTLAKQIAVDLVKNGHYSIWADISKTLEQSFFDYLDTLICKQGKSRTHLFLKFDMNKKDQNFDSPALNNLKNIFMLIKKRPYVSVYLVVDALHSAFAFDEIGYIIQDFTSEQIELDINMDKRELTDLIRSLREYNCLGKLKERKESELLELFTNKSNKILLVSLIETTQGMDEKENFQSILYREYMSLNPETRILYPLVALCHSSGVSIPSTLLSSVLSYLNPNLKIPSVTDLIILNFYGVLTEKFNLVTTRHPLIAKTLCNAIFPMSLKQNDSFWLQIVHSILISADEQNKDHHKFLIEFASEKVVDLNIKDSDLLIDLANRLYEHEYTNLNDESISILLNSISRIFQGKSEFKLAIDIAYKSLDIRNSINNFAKIILGYCYINIPGEKQVSKNIAEEIMTDKDSRPITKLHAIKIMFMSGFPTDAKFYIDDHKDNLYSLPGYSKLNEKVYTAAVEYIENNQNNLGSLYRFNDVLSGWSNGIITSLEASELYLGILKDYPFIIDVFVNYCHVCFRLKKLEEIIKTCDYIFEKINNKKQNGSDDDISEQEIKILMSMSLSTKAWAMHKYYGKEKSDEVHQLLLRSLQVNEGHAWGHYWRGIFLYQENNEINNAIIEIRHALSIRNIPPFNFGLAIAIFESNIKSFSNSKNREIIELCNEGLKNCTIGGYWGDELNNCFELLKEISISWKGSKDADADLLAAISNINESFDFNTLSSYI
jgi:DNA replication protein DnaC